MVVVSQASAYGASDCCSESSHGGADDHPIESVWRGTRERTASVRRAPSCGDALDTTIGSSGGLVAARRLQDHGRDPDVVRTPELAAEIVTRTNLAGGAIELTPADGEALQLDRTAALNLRPGTDPNEGDLLLYGTEPDGPWFWSGPLLDDSVTESQCATIAGPAIEQGDSILFEIGLRLPKAPDFDPAEQTDGQFTDPTRFFCVDGDGHVTRYGV